MDNSNAEDMRDDVSVASTMTAAPELQNIRESLEELQKILSDPQHLVDRYHKFNSQEDSSSTPPAEWLIAALQDFIRPVVNGLKDYGSPRKSRKTAPVAATNRAGTQRSDEDNRGRERSPHRQVHLAADT